MVVGSDFVGTGVVQFIHQTRRKCAGRDQLTSMAKSFTSAASVSVKRTKPALEAP